MVQSVEAPIWLVALACGGFAQVAKFFIYSAASRQLSVSALGQSHGLPSLPTAILSCLLILTGMKSGWTSSEVGFVIVFAIIAIHDTVKLQATASRQREVLHRLVTSLPEAGAFHLRVADYLDPRTHHPAHVVIGGILGVLFGLAFGNGAG